MADGARERGWQIRVGVAHRGREGSDIGRTHLTGWTAVRSDEAYQLVPWKYEPTRFHMMDAVI